jgi:hypothetical protein
MRFEVVERRARLNPPARRPPQSQLGLFEPVQPELFARRPPTPPASVVRPSELVVVPTPRTVSPADPDGMRFYLGTHHPDWLARAEVPLFVSHHSLGRYRTLPRAIAPWALDSGGFTEISEHGRWTISARDYARAVIRYRDEIGMFAWASPQDWMCEPFILQKTGLSVAEHQRRTIDSVQELRALGAPVIPVLQGWQLGDYWRHVEDYDRAGIDLRREPIVGLGSVCRRQSSVTGPVIVTQIAHLGIRLHGFGFKVTGLKSVADKLVSSDSLAWSLHARKSPPRPECRGLHKSCANCLPFALEWRAELFETLENDRRREARRDAERIARRR